MDTALIARGARPINLDKPRLLFFDKVATWVLLQKYGRRFAAALYSVELDERGKPEFTLKSMEALEFFLWLGLQAEAKMHGEVLAPKQVADWIIPGTVNDITEQVIYALAQGIQTPPLAGDSKKADAAAARPAVAAAKTARKSSTMPRRNASHTASSGKPRNGSGRKR